jgi:hypothetical protein
MEAKKEKLQELKDLYDDVEDPFQPKEDVPPEKWSRELIKKSKQVPRLSVAELAKLFPRVFTEQEKTEALKKEKLEKAKSDKEISKKAENVHNMLKKRGFDVQ